MQNAKCRIRTGLLGMAMCVFAASLVPNASAATLNVVATTSSMGMLARVVGGDAVRVTVLAPPDRDAHYLLAKPSMLVALRRADLLVAVGADLEVGWLPAALQSANNPRILPGQGGYFEGAAQVDLIEKGEAADRARGDVHPMGNPHYYMDPQRMARVASALAARLAAMTPAAGGAFTSRAEAFGRAVAARVPEWRRQAAGAPGAVFFHKDANYLAQLLEVKILGYIEPRARHPAAGLAPARPRRPLEGHAGRHHPCDLPGRRRPAVPGEEPGVEGGPAAVGGGPRRRHGRLPRAYRPLGGGHREREIMIPNCLLDVNALVAGYKNPVVGPVSFRLTRGEILGLAGPNGSGKSTVLARSSSAARVSSRARSSAARE